MAEPRTIRILTLSGGVSRQPSTKRTPYQAENLDNCLVSLERSVEKRPGFSMLPGVGSYDLSFLPITANPHFTWFQLDRQNRYLLIIDRNAAGSTDTLLYALKVTETGWTNITPETQWDPEDTTLEWNGSTVLASTDPRYRIWSFAHNMSGSGTILEKYNIILGHGMLNKDSRAYMTFGSGSPREVLKSLQIGTNTMYLNTKVYAGFTSGTSNLTVGLDGYETGDTDTIGRKVTYYTGTKIVKTTDGRMYNEGYTLREGEEFDSSWSAQFIPVEEFVYGDFEKPWLGQSVRNFGELRFPPDNNDWLVNNSRPTPSDTTARDMLAELYDPATQFYSGGSSPADGRGKIVYCDAPYLALDAGFYRIVSFLESDHNDAEDVDGKGKPYTQKVRSPDNCSVLDKKRMPQRLVFSNGKFTLEPIDWAPRTVGDRVTNPGPSPFLTTEGEARHVQISAISNYRDRLFFASGDVLFSSQLGVLEDLWLKDPSNVTVSDPIDIRASSNSYSEITALVPFNAFLFINTRGGVQFELKGQNNLLSPLTAEVSNTTFYTTAELVDPQTLGSQIYFLDKQRLYIYLNQDSREFNTAVELSNTVRGYLPTNYQDVTTAVAQNYIISVDADNKNHIYFYCNRFDGNQLIQSAFWRYILEDTDAVYSLKAWDNTLYAISKRETTTAAAWYLMTTSLETQSSDIPRMDSMSKLLISNNVTARAVETTLTIPYIISSDECYMVLADGFSEEGTVYRASSVSTSGNNTVAVFSGIDLTEHISNSIYVGAPFTMKIELSPLYVRDQNNNIIEGSLNLKTMTTRHCDTGTYRVEVTRNGRANKLVSEFSATNLENTDLVSTNGTFTSKIFGFSDSVNIQILNDKLSPANITQIEVSAIFNKNNSSLS
jgi:hypothetical protein